MNMKHSQFRRLSANTESLEDVEQEWGEEEANDTNRKACWCSSTQALSRIQYAPLLSVSSPSSHVPINFHDIQTQLHTEVDNILISKDTVFCCCLFWSQLRVFSVVNVWVDKALKLASSGVWTVCSCMHCLRMCVSQSVCLCLCCIVILLLRADPV